MEKNTVVIKNPSNKLLAFVRNLRDNKEQDKKDMLSKKDSFFDKK